MVKLTEARLRKMEPFLDEIVALLESRSITMEACELVFNELSKALGSHAVFDCLEHLLNNESYKAAAAKLLESQQPLRQESQQALAKAFGVTRLDSPETGIKRTDWYASAGVDATLMTAMKNGERRKGNK